MSSTRCTCIRDEALVRLVIDPTCPAARLHAEFPVETPAAHPR